LASLQSLAQALFELFFSFAQTPGMGRCCRRPRPLLLDRSAGVFWNIDWQRLWRNNECFPGADRSDAACCYESEERERTEAHFSWSAFRRVAIPRASPPQRAVHNAPCNGAGAITGAVDKKCIFRWCVVAFAISKWCEPFFRKSHSSFFQCLTEATAMTEQNDRFSKRFFVATAWCLQCCPAANALNRKCCQLVFSLPKVLEKHWKHATWCSKIYENFTAIPVLDRASRTSRSDLSWKAVGSK